MTKRKIVAITGIRSDYDLMTPVFKEINLHPELELELIVTGAHLSHSYGYTVKEIEEDGFIIAEKIESLINGDGLTSRLKGLAIQLQDIIQTIVRIKPDILLVLGDREESITTALVGAYLNIPVAHVAGGDKVIGNVDDQIRHAVTKLAHIHLTTNAESSERIEKLGEEPFRIFNVGNPGLDRIKNVPRINRKELSTRLNFDIKDDEPLLMIIQHVISSEVDSAYNQMKITMEAIFELGYKTIISYPNSDAGGQQLIKAIQEYSNISFIHIQKNIPRLEFVNILREASCLVGNSSAGILEAPYLKLPVINIGNRQKGRLHAENVTFVNHSKNEIKKAIQKSIFDKDYLTKVQECVNPYGDGNAAIKITNILANIPIDSKLLIKEITY
jgi:GDP/UDP-N,N'-diacetylbacillosamine 2-epimerase (hydrolysing)